MPCKAYEPGCDQKFFLHYQALSGALDQAIKANPRLVQGLGEEIETAYHGAWLQRYQGGMIVHLSQRVPFTPVRQDSHEGSTFIVYFSPEAKAKENGRFFFHWRPPVTGIYDVGLFKSILKEYPEDPGLLDWPQSKKISDDELAAIFRPHTESSPKNLSGGLAVIYAMYRLDRYISRPLEQQFTRAILRRNYKSGYILAGMPDPNSSDMADGSHQGYKNDVKFLYIFKTEKEIQSSQDTDKYAGGKKFRAGSWSVAGFEPGKAEQKNRPNRGLFRE